MGDPDRSGSPGGLLSGVRVLDLSIWRPGPYATQLLADLGADVLKIEPPGGDPMRAFPELFATLNGNKRSIVLDLKAPEDRARAHALVADADVVVEGFRPGVAARLGMGEAELRAVHPGLVYCSVSGYGQTGPLAPVPGHDLNYQAYAAVLTPDGGDPVEGRVPIADLAGGLAAAMGVCAALLGRSRTGEGEHVDVSMTDVLATWTGPVGHLALADSGETLGRLASYGSFRTADGSFITLGVITEQHFWEHVCDALGLDDLRDLDLTARRRKADDITDRLTAAIAARPRDELLERLSPDAPAAPALTRDEMLHHPQFLARDLVGGTTTDGYPYMGYPVRFGQHPARPPARTPGLGEHQDEGFPPRSGG
ncbi:MAG TPA: CoA transferase [Acidimicrobiia bacterium]|nr:CoA transferase [Acidimicrobiia bacterium]